MEHSIALTSVANARELGGFPAAGGKTVKHTERDELRRKYLE